MRLRQLKYLAGTAGLSLLTLGGAIAPTSAATVHVVPVGGSIQQVVDQARPGDTVFIPAGVYRGSVQVRTDRLTIAGAGADTRIEPGADAATSPCAAQGHGICVAGTAAHPLVGVRIVSLDVSGFTKDGLMATWTDRLSVRGVIARGNGEHGIRQDRSVRGDFRGNIAEGNAETGIFLANTVTEEGGATDAQGAQVTGNRVAGNRIGITVRRLQNLTVERNIVTGNCGGVFVVGDEGIPRAGKLTVRGNRVTENNRYCAASNRLPVIQGAGIVLTGVEEAHVTDNEVRDNKGESTMSGGIVLFPSFAGVANSRNVVTGNTVRGNQPADLADRDKGTGNVFTANQCAVSLPAGRC
ncbi:nitrous oxide reductase family maturation protein NosD [Streptomyces sp. NPDC092296]|uniref:right-handed parallel beta-helix repeat-containing protein n=1 Tax=Streptomyces sp. NPDC092296 TaxID=3366012 RepID=UPI003801BF0E